MKRLIALVVLLAAPLVFAQPVPLPPADPRYYRVNGADVRLTDGGTSASNALDARRNLDVPGIHADETIYGAWTFEGALTMGSTISVEDTSFSIIDNNVNSRVLKFDVTGISNATTRTVTVPNVSGTMTLNAASQTISNKTMDATNYIAYATSGNPGFTVAYDGMPAPWFTTVAFLGTIGQTITVPDVTGTVTINTASQTLTNKTLTTPNIALVRGGTAASDTLRLSSTSHATKGTVRVTDAELRVIDEANETKTAQLSLGGASNNADLTLAWSGTADRTATIPDATTTLAGLAVAQTFTALPTFQASGAGTKKAIFKGVAGQSAVLTEWQTSTGAIVGYVGISGDANFLTYNVLDAGGNTGSIGITDATLAPTAYIPSAAVVGSMALVGQGADPPASTHIGRVNRTAQSAAVTATNLTNGTSAGVYAVHYEMTCTTGDGTAGTLTFDVIATGDGGAQTVSSAALPLTTATLSATNPVRGTIVRYLASGNITYSTTVAGAVNAARYALRARCEMLGP